MHAQAAGYSIKENKKDKLITYANNKLEKVNFNEDFYCVNFERLATSEDLNKLVLSLGDCKDYWGTNCNEPIIFINDINISKKDINIIGGNKDTIRFEKNGITYIKFKAKNLINELSSYSENIVINLIGTMNINHWNGNSTPQIIINDLEIKNDLYNF